MHGSPPIEPHIVVCFGNSVKDEKRDCGSKVIMSGVNSNVIMSGYGDENPNDEGREAVRGYTNSLSGRADGGGGGNDDRSQLAARYGRLFAFGQGYNRKIVAAFLRSGRQFLKALSLRLL
jgi:hypothetical protein